MEIILTIPIMPPSTNHIYKACKHPVTGRSYKRLSDEVKAFRDYTLAIVRRDKIKVIPDVKLAVELLFFGPCWVTKKGTVARKDLDNVIKSTLDALVYCEIGFDDEFVWQIFAEKMVSEKNGVTIRITYPQI